MPVRSIPQHRPAPAQHPPGQRHRRLLTAGSSVPADPVKHLLAMRVVVATSPRRSPAAASAASRIPALLDPPTGSIHLTRLIPSGNADPRVGAHLRAFLKPMGSRSPPPPVREPRAYPRDRLQTNHPAIGIARASQLPVQLFDLAPPDDPGCPFHLQNEPDTAHPSNTLCRSWPASAAWPIDSRVQTSLRPIIGPAFDHQQGMDAVLIRRSTLISLCRYGSSLRSERVGRSGRYTSLQSLPH